MAHLSIAPLSPAATRPDWISNVVEAVRLYRARRREYQTVLRELSAMSDRDLADIGLSRFSVRDVARAAARLVTAA